MPVGRSIALVFLGVVLGISLTVGAYYGVKEYAPDLAARYLSGVLGKTTSGAANNSPSIDSAAVKSIVQEVLSSDQAKALLLDLMKNQSKENFDAFFKDALKSPEFRRALADALGSFLDTAEGKALLRRIATEALTQ